MCEQSKKPHISVGLLAHVGASRREPLFYNYIPGPKTGDFPCSVEAKLFHGSKIPPYVVVLFAQKPPHMVADFPDLAL